MEEGEELTVGEDWVATLVTEVSPYFPFMIYSLDHFNFFSSILLNSSSHLQALEKICLANHIRCMAELLHADVVQQLEVALLGSLVAQIVDLLSGGLAQTKSSTSAAPAQPHPQIYTSTPPAPPPSSVLVVGSFNHQSDTCCGCAHNGVNIWCQ